MSAPTAPMPATIASLAVAGYGAAIGALFPVVAIYAIADIGGGLSVAADSAALINTAQNVGSVIGILAAPAFSAGIGRGRSMALAGTIYTLASALAAAAPSLDWMIAARVLQGIGGGVMPLMFMLLVMTGLAPGRGRFEGMALFATSTTLLFGFAPALGGWLAGSLGWRAIFWIQAALGLPYAILAARTLRKETGRPGTLRGTDWAGYLQIVSGIIALTIAFSEGERHFWLEAWWVPALIVAGSILLMSGLVDTARASRPLIAFGAFRRPTFSIAILLSIFFRFGTLFAILIVPQYLARLQGYRPEDIGTVLAIMVPAAGAGLAVAYLASARLDARLPLSVGLACFAAASWLCTSLASDWAADQLRAAAGIAGFGMGLFQVAVLRFAVDGATMQDGPTVGMTFNLARVFGIVGGIAFLSHLVAEREKFHFAMIGDTLGTTDPTALLRLATTSANFGRFGSDPALAQGAATAALGRAAAGQAFTLAFADAFTITAIALAAGAILVWALPGLRPERLIIFSRQRN